MKIEDMDANEGQVEVLRPPSDVDLFEDLFDEPRDMSIYNLGDLKFEWIDEEDIEYTVRVQQNFHYKTSIKQVKASLDRLVEDNDKPDIMKWLEASNELEIFCSAAAEAGRDVIDFDVEATEVLDAVWELLEYGDNDGENANHEVNEDDDYNNNDDNNEDMEEYDDVDNEFNVGDGEEGPEYYKERI